MLNMNFLLLFFSCFFLRYFLYIDQAGLELSILLPCLLSAITGVHHPALL
jgi:hypothetical protein